jgi:hypothetical protein
VGHNINTFLSTSKKTLPIYATLTFVPMIVLQFFKLLRNPVTLLSRGSPLRRVSCVSCIVRVRC